MPAEGRVCPVLPSSRSEPLVGTPWVFPPHPGTAQAFQRRKFLHCSWLFCSQNRIQVQPRFPSKGFFFFFLNGSATFLSYSFPCTISFQTQLQPFFHPHAPQQQQEDILVRQERAGASGGSQAALGRSASARPAWSRSAPSARWRPPPREPPQARGVNPRAARRGPPRRDAEAEQRRARSCPYAGPRAAARSPPAEWRRGPVPASAAPPGGRCQQRYGLEGQRPPLAEEPTEP